MENNNYFKYELNQRVEFKKYAYLNKYGGFSQYKVKHPKIGIIYARFGRKILENFYIVIDVTKKGFRILKVREDWIIGVK